MRGQKDIYMAVSLVDEDIRIELGDKKKSVKLS